MIYSMTGYASKAIQYNNATINLEIKSVNHRFLDITIKTSEEFKSIDNVLRTMISQQISRGKIDVRIFFKEAQEGKSRLNINNQMLEEYLKLVNQIKNVTNNNVTCSVNDIIAFPGILSQDQYSSEEIQPRVLEAFGQMLEKFKLSQEAEGSKLSTLLKIRLEDIFSIVRAAQPLLNEITADYQAKLKERLTNFINESDINDARFQQEFAFFCQKMDVTEEIDRLGAHVSEFSRLLNKGGNIGKRLDFICQEMNREANTFGSKSVSKETTHKAVDLKVLIEQIREQVQNLM